MEGQPLQKPVNLQVDWQHKMNFDGRKAIFEHSVVASDPTHRLRTEVMEAQLQQPIRFADAKMDKMDQADRRDPLPRRRLHGKLHARSAAATALATAHGGARHACQHAQRPVVGGRPGLGRRVRRGAADLLGDAAGTGPADQFSMALSPTNARGNATAKPPSDQLGCMHVRYQGYITGDIRHEVTFHDRVRAAYAPVDSWTAMPDTENLGTLGPNGALLHCDELSVDNMAAPDSKTPATGDGRLGQRRAGGQRRPAYRPGRPHHLRPEEGLDDPRRGRADRRRTLPATGARGPRLQGRRGQNLLLAQDQALLRGRGPQLRVQSDSRRPAQQQEESAAGHAERAGRAKPLMRLPMKRAAQMLLIGTFLPLCWLAMMAVHELGHVVGALATGGKVATVVLYPLTISRTDVSINPRPLLVVWAGPLIGVLLPLAAAAALRACRFPWAYLLRFFAGFCLIANGAYIGVGSFDRVGDAGDMLRHGSAAWTLWLFGAVTFPLGLYLWHGLGPNFGLGAAAGKVDRRAAWASCVLLVATLIVELALSPR